MTTAPRPTPLLRSIALPVVVAAGLLLLALASMLLITTRSLDRMTPLEDHLAVMQRVQDHLLIMQHAALRGLDAATPVNRNVLTELKISLTRLVLKPGLLSVAGRAGLARAELLLDSPGMPPHEALARGIGLVHEALVEENRAHAALLHSVQLQAQLEKRLAAAALVLIPAAGLLVLFLLRRRFLLPLANINTLLARLGKGDYTPARMAAVDPVLEPLIHNYNQMAERLANLEEEHRVREATLTSEVQAVTRELLAHNRSLAQADRLAAVGEMAAGMAHELRNPLAGIQLALANLRQDLADEDARERLDLVGGELKRVTDLMNRLLDQARMAPEESTQVVLAEAVAEVLSLARYQVPSGVLYEQEIPYDLCCLVPENRLRQALLNLALNAAQVMPDGGVARIEAQIVDGWLEIAVSDQGPGFPETMLRSGVRPFVSARPGGTGLGLASVRRLAQDLGGKLSLENHDPHGAKVTMLLPCSSSPPSAELQPSA